MSRELPSQERGAGRGAGGNVVPAVMSASLSFAAGEAVGLAPDPAVLLLHLLRAGKGLRASSKVGLQVREAPRGPRALLGHLGWVRLSSSLAVPEVPSETKPGLRSSQQGDLSSHTREKALSNVLRGHPVRSHLQQGKNSQAGAETGCIVGLRLCRGWAVGTRGRHRRAPRRAGQGPSVGRAAALSAGEGLHLPQPLESESNTLRLMAAGDVRTASGTDVPAVQHPLQGGLCSDVGPFGVPALGCGHLPRG